MNYPFLKRCKHLPETGREPWSSGYGWWLSFFRSWVRILATNNEWHLDIFTLICCKNCIVCLKRPKINEKEAGVVPFKRRKILPETWYCGLVYILIFASSIGLPDDDADKELKNGHPRPLFCLFSFFSNKHQCNFTTN